jgi:hypothetical protein
MSRICGTCWRAVCCVTSCVGMARARIPACKDFNLNWRSASSCRFSEAVSALTSTCWLAGGGPAGHPLDILTQARQGPRSASKEWSCCSCIAILGAREAGRPKSTIAQCKHSTVQGKSLSLSTAESGRLRAVITHGRAACESSRGAAANSMHSQRQQLSIAKLCSYAEGCSPQCSQGTAAHRR